MIDLSEPFRVKPPEGWKVGQRVKTGPNYGRISWFECIGGEKREPTMGAVLLDGYLYSHIITNLDSLEKVDDVEAEA